MDQTTLLILALTLFGLGTINGEIIGYMKSAKLYEQFHQKLNEAIELKFEADQKIDALTKENEFLREENKKLSDFKADLVSLVHRNLPPPEGLERSNHYVDESDTESVPDLNTPLPR